MDEYITSFEALAFGTRGLSDVFYMECFISGLKEAIKAQVLLHHPPTWTEACKVARNVECVLVAQYSHPNFSAKGRPPQAHNTTQTLKSKRCHMQKWPKEESKDYVTTVMKNTPQVINARSPIFFKLMPLTTAHQRKIHHLRNMRR